MPDLAMSEKNVALSFVPSFGVITVCGRGYQTYLLDPKDCQDETHRSTILTLATGGRSGWNTGGLRLAWVHRLRPCLQVPQSDCRTACAKKCAWKRDYCRFLCCIFSLCAQKTWEVWEGEKRTLVVMDECVLLNFALLLDVLEILATQLDADTGPTKPTGTIGTPLTRNNDTPTSQLGHCRRHVAQTQLAVQTRQPDNRMGSLALHIMCHAARTWR